MNGLVFRKAEAQDIPAVARIYDAIHTAESQGLSSTRWRRGVYPTEETARAALERDDLFVELDSGRIVAAAIINHQQLPAYAEVSWACPAEEDQVMVLHTLCVDPALFRRGYGKAFMAFFAQYGRLRGCRCLRLDTNARNTQARAMYEKLGYREAGIVPCDFNGIPGIQLVLLEKAL